VDNKAYGMHGQVISPEPLSKSIDFIFDKIWEKIPVIYMSPSWDLLNQEKIENYYKKIKLEEEIIIICWHYEWIDQRIIDSYVDYEISIWEYVLSSWELAASVFIDSIVRNIPKVLWNIKSLEETNVKKSYLLEKDSTLIIDDISMDPNGDNIVKMLYGDN
jgi:tRNA (guanine37-N1)-methyltransferase